MANALIWNGVSSIVKHIRLRTVPEIVRPEERAKHITSPGRSGELTQLEGTDIYNGYIQTVQLAVVGGANVRAAEAWLRGGGVVTFPAQPTLKQNARIINAVTFRKISHNLDVWEGDVQFYCDPLKMLVDTEEDIEVTESGTTVSNPGDVESKPLIEITGSGDMTISAGGKTISLTGITSGTVIDSEAEWVLKNGSAQYGVYTGNFPVLPVGDSTVLFTGSITKLTITPRWRYL